MNLPTGRVTFMCADIAGGSELRAQKPMAADDAARRYDEIAGQIVPLHTGAVVRRIVGNGMLAAVFIDPLEALQAARALLETGRSEPWIGVAPQIRIALHTGQADVYDADYHSGSITHCRQLLLMAHGWQVLVSSASVAALPASLPLGMQLRDLGEYTLCDLSQPENLLQLLYPGLPADFPPLRSLANYPNNLPLHADVFVGREEELEEVLSLLSVTRLLTLIGSAGIGKTRLAQQAAARVLDAYPDGIWLVDFAAMTDAALAPQWVAAALKLPEEPGRPLIQTLNMALAGKQMLLIFDNCQSKISACSRLADALLRSTPTLKILATSRQGLGLHAEASYIVPALSLPAGRTIVAPPLVKRSEAAQLFLARAVSIVPDFAISTATASAIARICHRLDGIPLALELAASGLRSAALEHIDSQLDSVFRRITGEKEGVIPRQQTLMGAIEWSFDRLSAEEQALLCRLTVFRGGWTQAAAEAVCSGSGITLEQINAGLETLVDAMLLVEEEFEQNLRFQMPFAIAEYCQEYLESDEWVAIHRHHAHHFFALAQEGAAQLGSEWDSFWLERLEREQPNFRAALDWCQEDAECVELGVRLAGALQEFWQRRLYPGEGLKRISHLETLSNASHEASEMLLNAGEQTLRQGEYAIAQKRYEQALALLREKGDKKKQAQTLHQLGIVARERGDHAAAQNLHEEALILHRSLNDPIGEALHLHNLASALRERGALEEARRQYEQAYRRNYSSGNRIASAHNLNGMARVAVAQGDNETAHRLYTEALNIFQEANDTAWQAHNLREIVKLDLHPGLLWVENHR